jgi:hypothetical protein
MFLWFVAQGLCRKEKNDSLPTVLYKAGNLNIYHYFRGRSLGFFTDSGIQNLRCFSVLLKGVIFLNCRILAPTKCNDIYSGTWKLR